MSAVLASLALSDAIAEGRAALFDGDPLRAAALFAAEAEADPTDYESRYWLFSALCAAGQPEAAQAALEAARSLHAVAAIRAAGADMDRFQSDKGYCAQVGLQLYANHMMAPASVALGRALDFENLNSQTMLSYCLSLQHQGRMDEAIEAFAAAADIFKSPEIHQFLLYPLFQAPDRLARVSEEGRKWAALYADPLTPAKPVFANERTANRRLRVGYVGPSFTRNQVAQFLLPVLEAHDPKAVEVFLYCADPAGEGALPPECKVRAIGAMPDKDVVAQIRADKVDILIDTWGHTAGSRLTVFAHKPAPIQIAWINFVQSTGLASMDYVFHAESMDVPGTEQYFTEEIWRLGPVMVPFRPHAERPDPVATPALKNGHVTYGSFNNPAKLSEMTIAAWALILRARPQDKLVLKYRYFTDPVLQRVTRARFAAYGAQPEQLEFRGQSAGLDYLREFQDIDLALDPSPCPGGTTSCDAMANGVPVLTQWGDDFYARTGVPVALPCGMPELIADGWDDYVERAQALTADFEALDALRAKTRAGFDASPYRDEVGFTRHLEGVFHEMFSRWLTGAIGSAPAEAPSPAAPTPQPADESPAPAAAVEPVRVWLAMDPEQGMLRVLVDGQPVGRIVTTGGRVTIDVAPEHAAMREELVAYCSGLFANMSDTLRAALYEAPGFLTNTAGRNATAAIPQARKQRIHLGCGGDLRPGWLNIDYRPGAPVGYEPTGGFLNYDLRQGLPGIEDKSVDMIFSSHFFEHLRHEEAINLMRECRRVLKDDGVARFQMPDFRQTFRAYVDDDQAFLQTAIGHGLINHMPDYARDYGDMVSQAVFEYYTHKYIWDQENLSKALRLSGFSEVTEVEHDATFDHASPVRRAYSYYLMAKP